MANKTKKSTPQKKSAKHLPVRSYSHIQEDESITIFEKAIKPWMICSWVKKDYGIDAWVEITKPIANSKDQIVTGKRFCVQLKSSDWKQEKNGVYSISIPKEKINYWYTGTEPALLVFVHLEQQKCYFKWIDEDLIKELFERSDNWIARDTTTIRLVAESFINPDKLHEIEEYVIHWKRPLKAILSPGNYFRFSSEAKHYIEQLLSSTTRHNISFYRTEISELQKQVSKTIYTIAIAGPSRAGKSTLINALLHQDVSPIGIFPTTGIPITIIPNNKNFSVVVFKDGKQLSGTVDSTFLNQFTSQDYNPDNEKEIKLVSVNIINALLEKGFALCDVPGLDDPDDEIRAVTKTALYNVNAIIYVINAAAMNDGGFSFTKQMIDDLKELGGRMDRLFFVINKVDLLNEQLQQQLKNYVTTSLEKFKVAKYLPTPPVFISAKSSFITRTTDAKVHDSVKVLEDSIWEYLLKSNKTGLHKVLGAYADCKNLIDQLRIIISSRLLDMEKRSKVESEVDQVKNEISQVRAFIAEKRNVIYQYISKLLFNSLNNILQYLSNDLKGIPLSTPLHDKTVISTWLKGQGYKAFSSAYDQLDSCVFQLQSDVNKWISLKLKQVEINIETDAGKLQRMPDIDLYTSQIVSHFEPSRQKHPGVLETIFMNIGTAIEQLTLVIESIFTSDEKLRQKQIEDTIRKAAKSYKKIADEFLITLDLYLAEVCQSIESRSVDRTQVYMGILTDKLSELKTPLTDDERNNYNDFLQSLQPIESAVKQNYLYLQEYTDGIDWLKK